MTVTNRRNPGVFGDHNLDVSLRGKEWWGLVNSNHRPDHKNNSLKLRENLVSEITNYVRGERFPIISNYAGLFI